MHTCVHGHMCVCAGGGGCSFSFHLRQGKGEGGRKTSGASLQVCN